MTNQTTQERAALRAAWDSHPHVARFQKAVRQHVIDNALTGVDGMNATLRFANEWIAQHGELPESGILCT